MHDVALRIDPALTPEILLARRPMALLAPTHWTQAGKAYRAIVEQIGNQCFDTVLLIPWLKRGGADLGAIHHAQACQGTFGHRTLVIATEPGESPWAARLPEEVLFVQIGAELAGLSRELGEAEIVLARLLIEIAPTRVHIINSKVAWRTIAKYGKAIRQKTRLYASLYCDERDRSGVRTGLAQEYLPSTYQWLDAVISDNTVSPREWSQALGIAPELFHVVHFPAPLLQTSGCTEESNVERPSLLWASRLERQKRPDLLVSLAMLTPDYHWDVYGEPQSRSDPDYKALQRLNNVTLHGKYESFAELTDSEHTAYIYTTAWDGLPNVILEAVAARIPVIAPNIGGIADLIPTSALLTATSEPRDYLRAINELKCPERRRAQLKAQESRIQSFTFERFCNQLATIQGYSKL